jgi:hypothetical protein
MSVIRKTNMMHKTLFIIAIAFTFACSGDTGKSTTSTERDIAIDTTLSGPQYLVRACAADVRKQYPEKEIEFNTSFSGYKSLPSGEKQDFLCGQFRVQERGQWGEWIPFATIKTSGYEQWQGAQASTFCKDEAIVWNSLDDISSSLQTMLESMPK